MSSSRIVPDAGDRPPDVSTASSQSPADGHSGSGMAQPPPGCTESQHYAWHLRESASSVMLHAAMAPTLKGIDFEAYKVYRDRLLTDAGNPTDPVEVMIVEQLGLAHFTMGLMTAKETNAGHVNACGTYAVASARLMAEFRRSALALQAYRHASRQLARDPARDVAPIDGAGLPGDPSGENGAGGELIATTEVNDAADSIIPYARPEAV